MMRTTVLALCLAMTGCMSVPISTIVRMSGFDQRDFALLDPEVLRVRIKLPAGFQLDAAKSSLDVRITAPAGTHYGEFKLDQEAMERTQLASGLFSGTTWGSAYTLKLAAPSKKEFRALQHFIGSQRRAGEVLIAVKPILSSFPHDASSVDVWIDLRLSEAQGYFALVEAAAVPLEKIREASLNSAKAP